MTKKEAIKRLEVHKKFMDYRGVKTKEAIDMAIEALSAEAEQHNKDAISREGLLKSWEELSPRGRTEFDQVIMTIPALPSAEAVQRWRTGKPTESGKYMATLEALGHRYVACMHYGEPTMPSREIDGACWYMPDNEWGDVFYYDDADILAWMPLPEPYKGGDE